MKAPVTRLPGEIDANKLYKAPELCRRLGWGQRAYRQAKRAGLKTARFSRWDYVLGAHLIEFMAAIAEKQAAAAGEGGE